MCVGLGALPLLVLLSHFVVTPGEQLVSLCQTLAWAVDKNDLNAVQRHLADDFQFAEMDRQAFVNRLRSTLSRVQVDDPVLWGFDTQIENADAGVVTFSATARVRSDEMIRDRAVGRWRLRCRRTNNIWQVVTLETISRGSETGTAFRSLMP